MKICKRITVIVLTVLMLIPLVGTINSSAFVVTESHDAKKEGKGQYSYGDLTYNIINDEAVIMYSPSASGKVTIPDKIDNYKVTQIADYAFYNNSKITSISIGKNVWRVGDYAFDHCLEVESVTMGSSVEEIGEYAFRYCSFVDSISLPKNIARIGYGFIHGTDYYLCAKWADNILYIDDYLIEAKVSKISGSYKIKDGVTCIADGAFRDCAGLTEIIIPDSVITIGGFAFSGCGSLKHISIGKSVRYIHDYAFEACNEVKSIEIGPSVQEIGYGAFAGVKCMEVVDEIKYIGNYLIYGTTDATEVEVREGTIAIAERAFCDCTRLREVRLPSSLKSIGSVAFSGTNSLDMINIPASVTRIGGDAFKFGKKNIRVYVEDISAWCGISFENRDANPFRRKNATIVDDFYGNTVTEITVPDGVKSIGEYAFYNLTTLEKINIPDSVESIGYGCFEKKENDVIVANNSVTMVCNEGSYAYGYAKAQGMPYVPSCEHSFTNYISNNDFSCTHDGTETAVCDNGCGKTDTRVTKTAPGHSFTNYKHTSDFSCTTDETETAVCDNGCCKTDVKVIQKAPGHRFEKWVTDIEPTYISEGQKSSVCAVCSHVETVAIPAKHLSFHDVNSTHWYADSVKYCVQMGYINGMTQFTFAPNGKLTRAQFLTILAKQDGVDLSVYEGKDSGFTDVKSSHWYNTYICWAVEQELTAGLTPTTFGPNTNITRAQLARFFYVYSEKKGIAVEGRADISAYPDADKVAGWAIDGISWAVDASIINGVKSGDVNYLDPNGTATRAQATVMFKAFDAYRK
ncbi:MAG: leucine-rich repeat protein [Clostridia bacterium]|nr:leucine-rich repeat protein [Clostridia bacterium]